MRNKIILFPIIILSSISFAGASASLQPTSWKILGPEESFPETKFNDFSQIQSLSITDNLSLGSTIIGRKRKKDLCHFTVQELVNAASAHTMSQADETARLKIIEDKQKAAAELRAQNAKNLKCRKELISSISEKENILRHIDPAFVEKTQKDIAALEEKIKDSQLQLKEKQQQLAAVNAERQKIRSDLSEAQQRREALNEALEFEKILMADKIHNDSMMRPGTRECWILENAKKMQAAIEKKNKTEALSAIKVLQGIMPQLRDEWNALKKQMGDDWDPECSILLEGGYTYTFSGIEAEIQTLISEIKSPDTEWEKIDYKAFNGIGIISATIMIERKSQKYMFDSKKAIDLEHIDLSIEEKGLLLTFIKLYTAKQCVNDPVYKCWVEVTSRTQGKDMSKSLQSVYDRYITLRQQNNLTNPPPNHTPDKSIRYIALDISDNPTIDTVFSILSDETLTVAHRAQELENQIKQSSKQNSELLKRKTDLQAEITRLSSIIKDAESQLISCNENVKRSKELQEQFKGQELQTKEALEKEKKELEQIRTAILETSRSLSKLTQEIASAEEELDAQKAIPENKSAAQRLLLSIAHKSKDPALKRAAEHIEMNQLLDTLLSSSPSYVPSEEPEDITSPTAIESLYKRMNAMLFPKVPQAEILSAKFKENWDKAQASLTENETYEQWKKENSYLTLSNAISYLSLLSSLSPDGLMRRLSTEQLPKDYPLFDLIMKIRNRFYEHIAKHLWSADQLKKWRNKLIEAKLVPNAEESSQPVPQSSSSSSFSPRFSELGKIKSVAGKAPEAADYGHIDLPLPGGKFVPGIHTTISYTKGKKEKQLSWNDPKLIAPIFIHNLLNQKGSYNAQIEQKEDKTFLQITETFAFNPSLLNSLGDYHYEGMYVIERNPNGSITEPVKIDPSEIILSFRTDLSDWNTSGTSYALKLTA